MHQKPPLKLFNTLSRKKEEVIPLEDNHIKLYTCGPTVYDFAHIGNFRTYVFEDLLRRTIQYFGMKITQVMNLTDVDDKTIRGAIAKGITLEEYTKPFVQAFFDDLKALNIQPAEHYPAATEYIEEMIEMIETLIEKKYAYKGNDNSIYFSITHFSHYGCLSHLKMDELKTGASTRVATDEYDKENISDFVLWKAYDPDRDGKIFWDSPFGPGRPGWHLECSTMAMRLLGETLDIHVGGVDNMFPHHENEIAQSEACSGKTFSKMWLHSEHLLVDHKKMSKSLGNFHTFRMLKEKGFTGVQVRLLLLQTHYKTQLNFTLPGLEGTKSSLQRINGFIQRLREVENTADTPLLSPLIEKTEKAFIDALADDLNISPALAALYDFIRDGNTLLDQGAISRSQSDQILTFLRSLDTVLGIMTFETEKSIPEAIEKAFRKRQEARTNKNWALADELRTFIKDHGWIIEDTPTGARLKQL